MKKIAGILALSLALAPVAPYFGAASEVSALSAEDMITITGGTDVPLTLKPGQKVSVRGVVKSASSNITMVSVGIYDPKGHSMSGGSIKPNSTSYDLSRLDRYVEFNKLQPGKYTYRVFVTNGSESNYALVNQAFMVDGDGAPAPDVPVSSSIKISGGATIPSHINVGGKVSVYGTISSESKLTSVTVGVFDEAGNLMTGSKASPNSKSYNIKELDYAVKFNDLRDGAYVYRVTATNSDYSNHVVDEQRFTVGNGQPAQGQARPAPGGPTPGGSTASASVGGITLKGGTELPAHLDKGQTLRVVGTLTAPSKLTVVTVGVFDENGKLATGIKASPNRSSYDLHELDRYVTFNTLKDGIYYYRITAELEDGETQVLVQKKFAVGNAELTLYDVQDEPIGDDEPIDDDYLEDDDDLEDDYDDVPLDDDEELLEDEEGDFFPDTVNDDDEELIDDADDDLLLEDDGQDLFDDADDFIDGDDDEEFIGDDDDLFDDEDEDDEDGFIDDGDDFFDDEDEPAPAKQQKKTISATNVVTIPSSIKVGKTYKVYGTVRSDGSKLTEVTAGVFNSSGKLVTGKTVKVGAYSYNISEIDKYIRFNDLSAGTYTFKIIASNGTSRDVELYSKSFKMTK